MYQLSKYSYSFLHLLGNFKRVIHALTLGARKLRDVLSLPGETMGWRLEKFFNSSLERNGKGQRQDVNDPVTAFGTGRSELSELSGDFEGYLGRLVYGQMYHGYSLPGTIQHSYIPVASQVKDPSAWDVVRRLVAYRKNDLYDLRGLNVSTSMQPFPLQSLTNGSQSMGKRRGTGTYIPDMVCNFPHSLCGFNLTCCCKLLNCLLTGCCRVNSYIMTGLETHRLII